MKKFISITTILLCLLCIYSCRESEDAVIYPDIQSLNKKQKTESTAFKNKDSLNVPDNEKDPPIKDGHDWKVKSDAIQ
ncbi:hypothetical protein DRF65_16525 [Chryseobacterium pennae]|uniref:Uncharacterized protein n=1 Tax=Chryseobacterium pennae TaxID=2258962 RepID=A0A3D9C6E9_9FLAO|nr:hypothetical protein [Chryseobacterium pennae]REC61319.1 hypothetical protein DRF65_16525 [Chryseobacterium pennae]